MQYSLDSVVMDIKLDFDYVHEVLKILSSGRGISSQMDIRHWTTGKVSQFKENFAIAVGNGQSFFFGVGANWLLKSNFYIYCRLDFNPSKVGDNIVFAYFHAMLVSRAIHIDFKRFDVAIDIPVDRVNVWLREDQRFYKLFKASASNKTEYLGERDSHGHVKLYNKQLESKLQYPLTRLEITMDYELCSFTEFSRVFPYVSCFDDGQMVFDDYKLNSTDRLLVWTCLNFPDKLSDLDFHMKKKIGRIIERYVHVLEPSEKLYNQILAQILEYGKCNYSYLHSIYERYIETNWGDDVIEKIRRSVFQNMPLDR